MSGVRRIYVEKKQPYAVEAQHLKEEITGFLGVDGIEDVRVLIRYDVENISDQVFETACRTVFSEPPVDILYRETIEIPEGARVFSVEPLPGQFDQRADSAVQCVQFLNENEKPVVRTARTYILTGRISDDEFDRMDQGQLHQSRGFQGDRPGEAGNTDRRLSGSAGRTGAEGLCRYG